MYGDLHNHKLCRDLALSCSLVGREFTIVSVFGASGLRISTNQPNYRSRERGKSKGKGKGKIHRITVHEGPKYGFKLCLTLALDEGWVVKSLPHPSPFTPGKGTDTYCTGGWVGPRASLGWRGKCRLHRDSIPGPSNPVASPYTDYAIPAHES